jgi:hypothetical protein
MASPPRKLQYFSLAGISIFNLDLGSHQQARRVTIAAARMMDSGCSGIKGVPDCGFFPSEILVETLESFSSKHNANIKSFLFRDVPYSYAKFL